MPYYYRTYPHAARESSDSGKEAQRERERQERIRIEKRRAERENELDQGTAKAHAETTRKAIDAFPNSEYSEEDIDMLIDRGEKRYSAKRFGSMRESFDRKKASTFPRLAKKALANEWSPYEVENWIRKSRQYPENAKISDELESEYQTLRPSLWLKKATKEARSWSDEEMIRFHIAKAQAFPENAQAIGELESILQKRLPKIRIGAVENYVRDPSAIDRKQFDVLLALAQPLMENPKDAQVLREAFDAKRGRRLVELVRHSIRTEDHDGYATLLRELRNKHGKAFQTEIEALEREHANTTKPR